ncbi:MAG TPA: tripartite tricarboxylate transporter substrate binding protein, partial [Burkholderiales bacterium]|nr:tripartite tricarboxylate transporter substrate binding protein [Burkholderiales bacterium]
MTLARFHVYAATLCAIACIAGMWSTARAQGGYPSRPVRVIVPSVAGGGLDALARAVAQSLNERLGVPFIVDNRPGAGGTIGIESAAHAAADGHTLLIISATHAATSTLQGKGRYDLLRDFAPIAWATTQPYILNVNSKVPARTLKELIALAKAEPDTVRYGSPGSGSAQHLAGVLLTHMSGARFFHVPYKGGAQVLNDTIAGQIQMSFTNYLVCRPHIQSGRLRALAVTTLKRSNAIPELPAISELLPGYDADNWYGFVAPAATPASILDKLHAEISAILNAPEAKKRLAAEA